MMNGRRFMCAGLITLCITLVQTENPVLKSSQRNEVTDYAPAATGALAAIVDLNAYANYVKQVRDGRCRSDLNATIEGVRAGQQWANAIYDASQKSASGIQNAVLYQFGHFDQCLSVERPLDEQTMVANPIVGKYCLADVILDVTVATGARRQPLNSTTVHWGFCVPSTCAAPDVAMIMQHLLQHNVTIEEDMCQTSGDGEVLSPGKLIYTMVVFTFVLIAVASTLYHLYTIWSPPGGQDGDDPKKLHQPGVMHMALIAFSVIENTKKIFQSSKDQLGLNSINGIKALAMFFILAGHAISFIYGGSLYNVEFLNEQTRVPLFAFISNSLLFVDVFLLLSGFLFCRILLIELEQRRGKINPLLLYLGRYIRLTPAYMAIIGFYMTWLPSIGSGPLWPQRILREQARCIKSWWLNILYINNYKNTDQFCMFQSWYLSVDSQLFFLAPALIFLLHKNRRIGKWVLAAVFFVTTCIPFVVTYVGRLDPTLLVYPDEISDLSSNSFYIGSYIKTHMRASSYVCGLLVGYVVHIMQGKKLQLPSVVVRLLWLLAVVIGTSSMFAIAHFYAHSYTNLESTMYSGFHKLGWNLSVAWLVVAVTTGHASGLRWLSNRFFTPISRLTYCAYLANGLVELYHTSTLRQPVHASYVTMFNSVLSHSLNTFFVAFVLCLLFESPVHALERILLRKKDTKQGSTNAGKGQTAQNESNQSQSPSTSEENVA